MTLKITEIFLSLQGEAVSVGYPTVFIRLTGCPLRCQYCDTSYAFKGGEKRSIGDIVSATKEFGVQHVTVTGGEPLAQSNSFLLMERLCDAGFSVSLETSGAMDVSQVDPRVVKVVDIKTPASGESQQNHYPNLSKLASQDQVKFVICNQDDYQWSCGVVREYALDEQCHVLFSPSHNEQNPTELADWIVADRLPVRFQVQLHKYLWADEPGR
ncbi:MAG: 7-carboxy-7-deazaguanine synthase QueE [Gammaproteobacteria bacterium]